MVILARFRRDQGAWAVSVLDGTLEHVYGGDFLGRGGGAVATRRWTSTRLSASGVALGAAAVVTVALGLAMSSGWELHVGRLGQGDVFRSLSVTGGAVLFGAGLLHMSMWRLGEDAARAYAGARLVVLGLLSTLTAGTGDLLHDGGAAAVLNPLTVTWTALAALGLVVTALTSGLRGQTPQVFRPTTLAAMVVVATMFALGTLGEVRRHVRFEITLSPSLHVQLELLVAAAWGAAAVLAHQRARRGATVPAVPAAVLAALSLVWLMRAAAVTDLAAWGVASAALMAAAAVVVLTSATSDFVDATEAEHTRADEAEQAVVSAAYELQRHDDASRALDHDARNMLLALRTASKTLSDYGDRLGSDARHELERAIAAEAAKLDELIVTRAAAARGRAASPAGRPAPSLGFVPAQRGPVVLETAR